MITQSDILKKELIQIRPKWDAHFNGTDVNIWSRVHPRFSKHKGCIVDLGCLGWNKDFNDITSDNWAGYFFDKKRVIGVDPQEVPNAKGELFKGFVSNFTGKADLTSEGIGGGMVESPDGAYNVISWSDFKLRFKIDSISILKINIEGAEWDLLDSFTSQDFEIIDQICVSFHDFLLKFPHTRTEECIKKLTANGYAMVDLELYGWKLFAKQK